MRNARGNFKLTKMENVLGVQVKIHSVVLFTIVDSFERRSESSSRVIGTLLGSREKGVVEIHSAYAVPHNESEDEVAVDMDFDREMLKLHHRVSPNEVIVGWFSTRSSVTMHSVLIHDYYSRLEPNSVFVSMDTTLRNERLDIKAFVKSRVGIPGKCEGVIFTPVPCEVVYFDPEKVGVGLLQRTRDSADGIAPIVSEFKLIENAVDSIDQILGKILEYVEDVTAGKIPANNTVGRLLMDMISRVPKLDQAQFETMLNATMQDLLMVVYLANLTKTQVTLGEKLAQLPS